MSIFVVAHLIHWAWHSANCPEKTHRLLIANYSTVQLCQTFMTVDVCCIDNRHVLRRFCFFLATGLLENVGHRLQSERDINVV
jgi:hypothetical protein